MVRRRRRSRNLQAEVLRVARCASHLNAAQIAARVRCHPSTARRHLPQHAGPDPSAGSRAATPLPRLAVAASGYARTQAAADAYCPPRMLARLAYDIDADVRRAVAANPNCPPRSLAGLAGSADLSLQWRAAANPSTPARLVRRLAGSPQPTVRGSAADNPACPAEILDLLASDRAGSVRVAVAANPGCSESAFTELAHSERDERAAVAANPSTPPRLLERLAGDELSAVRCQVATNPSSSSRLLERLAGDENPMVRIRVAANPTSSTLLIRRLANDDYWPVAATANAAENSGRCTPAPETSDPTAFTTSPPILPRATARQWPRVRCGRLWPSRSTCPERARADGNCMTPRQGKSGDSSATRPVGTGRS